jgi:dCTP diphosphatase
MTNEINELMKEVREFSEKRNWTQFHNPKDLAIALVLEAGEVLEHFRFKQDFNKIEVSKEISDVLNCLLRLSDVLEIELVTCFMEKMKENEEKYPVKNFYGKNLKYSEVI